MNFEGFLENSTVDNPRRHCQIIYWYYLSAVLAADSQKIRFSEKIITEFVKLVGNQFQPSRMYAIYSVHKLL